MVKLAPWWVVVLEAAEAWGTPPWELANSDSEDAVLWYERFRAYRDARIKAQPKQGK